MICFVALNMMSPKRNGKENREPLFCGGMLSGLMLCTCMCRYYEFSRPDPSVLTHYKSPFYKNNLWNDGACRRSKSVVRLRLAQHLSLVHMGQARVILAIL